MSTPTDPYNSGSRRPFDDDESILEPLESSDDADKAAWDRAFESDEPGDVPDGQAVDADADVSDDAEPAGEPAAEPSDAASEPASDASEPSDAEPSEPAAEPDAESHNPTLGSLVSDEPVGPTRTSVMSGAAPMAPAPSEGVAIPSGPAPAAAGAQVPAEPALHHSGPAFPPLPSDNPPATDGPNQPANQWAPGAGDSALALDIPDQPKGRGLMHFLSVLVTLLLVPVAWYLMADSGARLGAVVDNPWITGSVQVLPLLEMLGAFAVLAVIWLFARSSSLGAQVIGAIVGLAGVVALIIPKTAKGLVESLADAIGGFNDFTGNVVFHLANDLATGRIAIFGLLLFLTGLVAHIARRRGERHATAVTRRNFLLGRQ
ncbi:hypothetical protein [Trueperella bialowiezensis]|uniref:Uncharacterized protein n=1 Tax=Trueperella bialowiezensis TaxID=312285 RepID=A0A3S4YXR8_9ACTO|nr:hypothetical protein [Trueperella bialowiezensis]VEI13158.1 Uncharacterised protein [Trueperella bialowiezensis]